MQGTDVKWERGREREREDEKEREAYNSLDLWKQLIKKSD